MTRTLDELTAHIDDDFKQVIEQLKALFVKVATAKHGRATHTYGVAARGALRIAVPQGFPESDLFTPGRTYPVILRHSRAGGLEDDRTLDLSAASVKLFEPGGKTEGLGIHDILMNTGRVFSVNSARAFNTTVHTPFDVRVEKLLKPGILNDEKLSEAFRNSGSYLDSYYHSLICYEYVDRAGTMRYLRYRMINADRGPERGAYPESFRPLGETFLPPRNDDKRAHDYLRQDFVNRVKHGGVSYILQVQMRPTDDPEALDCTRVWDERHCPWLDVGEISVEGDALSADALDALEFDVNRTHPCVSLPLATGADDYASVGHCRALVYAIARKARAQSPQPHVG